jgi:hypothetical protein
LAGLGRKVFNSGDILLASEVQGYLQDQAVMVFDDSATRATAIGTANFSEGMVTYTKDNDSLEVYDGSTFKNFSGGLVHIETRTLSAVAAENFDNVFSATYDNYFLTARIAISTSAGLGLKFRTGGADNSTANYNTQRQQSNVTTVSASTTIGGTSSSITTSNEQEFSWTFQLQKPFNTDFTFMTGEHTNGAILQSFGLGFAATTSFDGFVLFSSAGNMTGSISIFGYAKV